MLRANKIDQIFNKLNKKIRYQFHKGIYFFDLFNKIEKILLNPKKLHNYLTVKLKVLILLMNL